MIEWIYVTHSNPIAYETGDWYGKRSDEIVAENESGIKYVVRYYEGFLDGSTFSDWYDINTDCYIEGVVRWIKLPN